MIGRRELVEEALEELNPDALFMDGLDEALLGYASQQFQRFLPVYSYRKILEILMKEGASYEEASEHFSFNIEGAWVGENTPWILHEVEDLE